MVLPVLTVPPVKTLLVFTRQVPPALPLQVPPVLLLAASAKSTAAVTVPLERARSTPAPTPITSS